MKEEREGERMEEWRGKKKQTRKEREGKEGSGSK
jgi:hypothetical protein